MKSETFHGLFYCDTVVIINLATDSQLLKINQWLSVTNNLALKSIASYDIQYILHTILF
jgi:hypothetical protein